MPHVVLEVEDHHAAQDAQDEAPESGRLTGQRGGRPPQPLGDRSRKDVEQVVVDGDAKGGPDVLPGDGSVRMKPVAVNAGPGGRQQVQHGVDTYQEEVGGDGEDHREGRAPQEVVVVLVEVVPERLQHRALGLSPSHVVLTRHPG